MNKFYVLLGSVVAISICVFLGVKKLRSIPPVDRIEFASVSPALSNTQPVENCQSKKTCLIIYVAPWCGACQMFIERQLSPVSDMIAKKEMGMLIVVGADTPEKNSEHAKKLGALAGTDKNDEFMRKNKIEYFPFFIVTSSGQMTHHGQHAWDWLAQNMNEHANR